MDRKDEIRILATEVKLIKEVLFQRESRLKEICDHHRIKRGRDSLYYRSSIDPIDKNDGYTYECLDCGQKWKFETAYEKFEKRANETLKNG